MLKYATLHIPLTKLALTPDQSKRYKKYLIKFYTFIGCVGWGKFENSLEFSHKAEIKLVNLSSGCSVYVPVHDTDLCTPVIIIPTLTSLTLVIITIYCYTCHGEHRYFINHQLIGWQKVRFWILFSIFWDFPSNLWKSLCVIVIGVDERVGVWRRVTVLATSQCYQQITVLPICSHSTPQ